MEDKGIEHYHCHLTAPITVPGAPVSHPTLSSLSAITNDIFFTSDCCLSTLSVTLPHAFVGSAFRAANVNHDKD